MARDDFGPRLREERVRRGISLDEIAIATNVSVELWDGMERNDFSRWPSGVFARAFVRDYARAVGLDSDAVVNEFCRHFPIGDRRGNRIVRAQAELIGHPPEVNDAELLPAGRERRKPRPTPSTDSRVYVRYAPRVLAATIDALALTAAGLFGVSVLGAGLFTSVGVSALLYFTVSTVLTGASPGIRVMEALRLRAPSLFTSRRTVNA